MPPPLITNASKDTEKREPLYPVDRKEERMGIPQTLTIELPYNNISERNKFIR